MTAEVAIGAARPHTPRVKLAWLFALLAVAACDGTPIGQPAGDNNYDDPDDPGNPGIGSGGPDASGDANGRPCTAARDCPAAFVCAYAIANGCQAAGECLPYVMSDTGTCDAGFACGCDDAAVQLCAPTGYAPIPVQSATACGAEVDGGDE